MNVFSSHHVKHYRKLMHYSIKFLLVVTFTMEMVSLVSNARETNGLRI